MDVENPGGLLPNHDESQDLSLEAFGAGTGFDWEAGYDLDDEVRRKTGMVIPPKHQDQSGSCGGQATAFQHEKREALSTGSFEESSAKFVIAQTFVVENGVMLGSRMKDNLALASARGICRESLLPSYPDHGEVTDDFLNRPQDITDAMRADALTRKGDGYGFVQDLTDIDVVARAAQLNRGLQVLLAGENNGTWTTDEPAVTKKPQWRHFQAFIRTERRHGKRGIVLDQTIPGFPKEQWFSEDWFAAGQILQAGTLLMADLPLPQAYRFTRNLTLGSTGPDVKLLQAYLNAHGSPVAASGPGSPGQETTTFGPRTKAALSAFQARHGISPSVGFFGPLTRAYVNAH